MATEHLDVRGKVALITGGARGIGFGTARALARRGATLVIVDLDQAACDEAAAQLGGESVGIAADVTDLGAMQRVVATVVDRFGGLDIVMANAGIASKAATFNAMSRESFDRVFEVNAHGVVRTVEAALPEIIRRRGHVVVVASVYAFLNGVGAVPYAMSKAAVEQLGRALRVELAQHGASATTCYFGFIDTEMVHRGIDDDPLSGKVQQQLPRVLAKRLTPDQAGEAVAQGIERRAPRVIVPPVWRVLFHLRGIIGPLLDRHMERAAPVQELAVAMEARANEEQPTTA
ncbi:short-chain dehydrogenase/reductase [Svornostia abyssi]|uniref:Short-chain dehydrogenase/reductase n=1 Tax=Svornostia abyssi TaxID=2898438 RepID=A0ABY5PFB2_9ACTN|nr:short-chain dehydrogenase/reductase [Parviterribacteraceae bacterium J379]